MRYDFVITRLANEYLSKIKCCDECFCNCHCILNGTKKDRRPHDKCVENIVYYLVDLSESEELKISTI